MEIDLGAVVHNAETIAQWLGGRPRLAPVVKANAYGHGAIRVARILVEGGFDYFCVATVDEALELRQAGIRGRLLLLYQPPLRCLPTLIEQNIEVTLGDPAALKVVAELPSSERRKVRLQLKVDTGFTRQGLDPRAIGNSRIPLKRLAGYVTGIWTHLADGAHPSGVKNQQAQFDAATAELRRIGVDAPRHVAASAALMAGHGHQYEYARPGLILYGAIPEEFATRGLRPPVSLRPAMAVRALSLRITTVRTGTAVGYGGTFVTDRVSRLATLPLGYGDGLQRALGSGVGSVLVKGVTAPIVGRISMDSCVVDVTDAGRVAADDVFTILGSDESEAITLEDCSRRAGTIPHVMAVGFNLRLPRNYVLPSDAGQGVQDLRDRV